MTNLIYYLASVVAVVCVFSPHEFAHAFVAYRCGDGTAKMNGRLTLNPIKHLDPAGFIMCIVAGFGWAKPVPINPYNFRRYRRGLFCTAVAGVIANYIIAFISYPLFLLVAMYAAPSTVFAAYVVDFVFYVFLLTFIYSLSVFIFNLIPLYPLDGFRVLESLTREVNPVRRFLRNYGQYILIILVLESFLCGILQQYASLDFVKYFDILGYLQWFAVKIIGYPVTALWNLVFNAPSNVLSFILYSY